MRRLPRTFYARDTRVVARELIGCTLCRRWPGGTMRGRIVETEAYHGPDDAASHARFGPTPRARLMFGAPGVVYVYLIYGMYHCFNLVCGERGFPAAVLVRGVDRLRVRGGALPWVPPARDRALGPGRLGRAFGLSVEAHNGLSALGPSATIFIEGPATPPPAIKRGPRVGVDYAGAWAKKPWRYRLNER